MWCHWFLAFCKSSYYTTSPHWQRWTNTTSHFVRCIEGLTLIIMKELSLTQNTRSNTRSNRPMLWCDKLNLIFYPKESRTIQGSKLCSVVGHLQTTRLSLLILFFLFLQKATYLASLLELNSRCSFTLKSVPLWTSTESIPCFPSVFQALLRSKHWKGQCTNLRIKLFTFPCVIQASNKARAWEAV